MKTFLLIIFVAIAGIFIFLLIKYPALIGIKPIAVAPGGAAYTAFITACQSKPYSNPVTSCNAAWNVAQPLGITTYAGWAKYQCDQGHC